MSNFTILGASGFIGGNLARHLRSGGADVLTPDVRQGLPRGDCGHIVYCIGLTADFRRRPLDTMRAHVCTLADVLEGCRFESLVYLSSTRVYAGNESAGEEARLRVDPAAPGDLYNLSKLAGESLCLSRPEDTIRVARLSNVFGEAEEMAAAGNEDFLPALVGAAARDGRVRLETAPESAKDYIWVGDAVRALERIAISAEHRLYNVASGRNVSHGDIAGALRDATGCDIEVAPGAPRVLFPRIDTSRIAAEFVPPERPWAPAGLLDRLDGIIKGLIPEPVGATP